MKHFSIGLLLWLMASLVQAQELELSIDQVLSIFYKHNLDVIAAQYAIERSRAHEIIAAAIPNPVFTSDIQQIAPRNNDKLGPYYGFAITQLIQTAGKRSLRMESSYLGTKAVEEDLQNVIRILSNSVRKSYYTLLLLQKNAEVLLENIAQYEEIIKINRLRLEQGDIAESDFLRINLEKLKLSLSGIMPTLQ